MASVQITSTQLLLQRVADYARLSDDDAKEPGDRGENVRLQLDECSIFRQSRPDWQHVASFHDNDISASAYGNEEREDFDKLMALVRASGVEVILTVEVTRLFRKPLEAEVLIDLVWSKKTSFHTIVTTRGGYYDLRTSVGRKAVRDAVNTAAGESDNISDRVRLKKGAQARKGLPNGGARSYGFAQDGITHIASEREVWLEGRRRTIQGESARAIVTDFNARGIPTTKGKRWCGSTLTKTLRRPKYMGKREHHGVLYDAIWEGFVTPEEWEELQLALRANERFLSQRGDVRKYLLGGFVFCGSCGQRLNGKTKRDPGADRTLKPRYHCRAFDDTGARKGCGGVSRLAAPLEDFVAEAILYRFDSEDFAKAMAESVDDMSQLRDALEEHQAKKIKLSSLIEDYYGENPDDLSRGQFMAGKAAAEAALERVGREVEKLTPKRALTGIPFGITLRQAWDKNIDLSWRRQIIALVIDKVIVHPGIAKPQYKQWHFDTRNIEIIWKV